MGKQHREQLSCVNTLSRDRFIECKRNRDGLDIIATQRRQEWSRGRKRVWTDFKTKKKQSRQRRKRRKKDREVKKQELQRNYKKQRLKNLKNHIIWKLYKNQWKSWGKLGMKKRELMSEHIESIIKRSEKRRKIHRIKQGKKKGKDEEDQKRAQRDWDMRSYIKEQEEEGNPEEMNIHPERMKFHSKI